MNPTVREEICAMTADFRLPAYHEIPDVGLYLEQTAKYISDFLAPLHMPPITGSMISNYVKKGLIASPVRKQYCREQIAYLIFIAVAKSVVSMDDLDLMIHVQRDAYSSQIAYDYFCSELRTVLREVFSGSAGMTPVSEDAPDQKVMLRNLIIAVAHKAYLDNLFVMLRMHQSEKAE